ncbi:MAG TPA: helix-turn-helix domain-containing protein [Solirubrobacteraceae bacterium]|nr:helix-turn-helix domain-containing protein [Solirubrobacteraceae bacterium]
MSISKPHQVMHLRERSAFTRVHLLREDPDLGAAISPGELNWATEHCVVPAVTLPRGTWSSQEQMLSGGIGYIVLDGLLLRRVGIDGRFGGELLGEGDLLRPWQGENDASNLSPTTGWKVITRSRLAVLDERSTARLARYPALFGAITGRALDRARRLALMMAIVHHPRIEIRLHMLFWLLADRWGRVGRDGVTLPLSLSHSLLADLIAAQRPSVTGALGKLYERGLVTPADRGWLLTSGPPGEFLEIQEVEVPGAEAPESVQPPTSEELTPGASAN